jgi:regulator of RNase E activity RraA
MVYGDRDGVIIVPDEAVEEAFTRALEKARGEKKVLRALQEGMSARDAFDKFGIM